MEAGYHPLDKNKLRKMDKTVPDLEPLNHLVDHHKGKEWTSLSQFPGSQKIPSVLPERQALNKDLVSFPTPAFSSPKVKGKRGLKRCSKACRLGELGVLCPT